MILCNLDVFCFLKGLQFYNTNIESIGLNSLVYENYLDEKIILYFNQLPRKYQHDPDVFYSLLSLAMRDGLPDVALDKKVKDSECDRKELLSYIVDLLSDLSGFHGNSFDVHLQDSFSGIAGVSDKDLLEDLSNVSITQELKPHVGHPFVYAKINHGYWEFLVNSYCDSESLQLAAVRDLKSKGHPENWRATGFHEILFRTLKQFYKSNPDRTGYYLGIGLSAGTEKMATTLAKPMNEVSRGAAAGLSCFLNFINHDVYAEGDFPRSLLLNQELTSFFNKFLCFDVENTAIVLVLPPSIKNFSFKDESDRVFKFVVPGATIHENIRVVTASFLGYINDIAKSYKNIVVFNQSAVASPLLGAHFYLFFDEDESVADRVLRFYDLGRVMDVPFTKFSKQWPSVSSYLDTKDFIDLGSMVDIL